MEQAVDTTPLLVKSNTDFGRLRAVVSECKLQEKCFLSDGAIKSAEGYQRVQRKLVIACILCFVFMAIEVVGGYIAKSVAIMSDAAHMLSDVSAFLVSIFATWAATQPSSWHYSFGYHRAEILGALVSVLTIWAVTGALVFEAFQRTINPVRVDGKLMFIIASAGVVFNILIALTLGVHAHLGHSHGPGGCSGHDHHHEQHHDHDHHHGHEQGQDQGHLHDGTKYTGCSHSHPHSHTNGHSHQAPCSSTKQATTGGCCRADQRQAAAGHASHQTGDSCKHEPGHQAIHSHSSDSGCRSSHSHDVHSHSDDDEHHHTHTHTSSSGCQSQPVAAELPTESVVINMPSLPAATGPEGDTLTCCTIKQTGSREIEVRYELPVSSDRHEVCTAAPATARVPANDGGHSHDPGSINLRSAVLHVIGDLLQSVGVAIAGGLIWLNQDDPRWYLADPICTFVFSIVVLLTTKSVLRDIVHVLMERTPQHMDIPAVSRVMMGMEGIRDVHDLHIWNISTSMKPVLTAHVHIGPDADPTAVLQKLEEFVRGLGIDHSTIQICNPQHLLEAQLPAPEE